MKTIFYYIALLVFIVLLSGFLLTGGQTMTMPGMFSISAALAAYVVALSLVGEGRPTDERETAHRYAGARIALVAATAFMSAALLYQLFTHQVDYLLLASLIVINLSKIISLLYQHYQR